MWTLARRSVLQANRKGRCLSNRAIRLHGQSGCSSTIHPARNYSNGRRDLLRARLFSGHVSLANSDRSKENKSATGLEATSVTSNEGVDDSASEDDTSSNHDEGVDTKKYEEWHNQKQQELEHLSTTTDQLLTAVSLSNNEMDSILELMSKWKEFNTQITPEMHSLSPFRKKNPQYRPSEFMTIATFEAAAKCQSLLTHLLAGNNAPPRAQVKAYKLCMETWSQVYHSSCGDRTEDILESYGERFGGDMDLAPTLDCYKIVLRGHERSCSSYFTPEESVNREDGERTPGEKAWDVLNLLSEVSGWDLYLKPDVELYSQVISTMRHGLVDWKGRMRNSIQGKKSAELAIKAVKAFEEMKSLLQEQQNKLDELSLNEWRGIIRSYGDIIAIVSKVRSQGNSKFKLNADELLRELEDFVSNNSDTIIRTAAIDGDSALLKDMQGRIEEAYTSAITSQLNSTTKRNGHFSSLGEALKNVERSEQIFGQMKDRAQASSPFLFPAPTQNQYSALIECVCECLYRDFSGSGDRVMGQLEEFPHSKATRLLSELEELHAANPDNQPIDGSIYASVMWGKCQVLHWKSIMQREKYFEAADAIQEFLETTEEKHNAGRVSFSSYKDATLMYNAAYRFYSARSKNKKDGMSRKIARRALRLFYQLQHWHDASGGKIRPDDVTFSLIIKILSDNGSLDDKQSFGLNTLFARMESFGIKPNEKHYHAAIRAQNRQNPSGCIDDSPMNAESLLQHAKEKYAEDGSVKPTTTLYTECISAYGASVKHNSIAKVLELANELTSLYKTTKDAAFKPDMIFYSTIIDALSKVKSDEALDCALRILDEAETMHSSGEVEDGPNRYVYTNVLNAIAKSSKPNRAKMADDLMQRMIKRAKDLKDDSLLPDTVTYTSLIQALANSREKDSIDRALKWFREMESQYLIGNDAVRPNKMTYTALINCWSYSNRPEAPEKVASILTKMEEAAEEGHFDSKPDAFVYGSIIKMMNKSKSDDKAARVWRLYERMKSKYESGDAEMKPNNIIVSYGIVYPC